MIKISNLNWSLDKKVLESQIRQLYGDVVWGHRTQEYQANLYIRRYNYLEVTKILLSTITTSGLIGSIIIDHSNILEISTAVVSMVTLFITTYTKTYNLNDLYKQYKSKALQFLDIRERLLNLLYSLRVESITMEQITTERDKIVEELKKIHMSTNEVSKRAIYFVSKSLKMDDNNIYSEEEIDEVLPSILKLGKRKNTSNIDTKTIPKEINNVSEVKTIEKLNVEYEDEG